MQSTYHSKNTVHQGYIASKAARSPTIKTRLPTKKGQRPARCLACLMHMHALLLHVHAQKQSADCSPFVRKKAQKRTQKRKIHPSKLSKNHHRSQILLQNWIIFEKMCKNRAKITREAQNCHILPFIASKNTQSRPQKNKKNTRAPTPKRKNAPRAGGRRLAKITKQAPNHSAGSKKRRRNAETDRPPCKTPTKISERVKKQFKKGAATLQWVKKHPKNQKKSQEEQKKSKEKSKIKRQTSKTIGAHHLFAKNCPSTRRCVSFAFSKVQSIPCTKQQRKSRFMPPDRCFVDVGRIASIFFCKKQHNLLL